MGDSSDNIPGVPGIGEKTAMDLIRRYRTVDAIYAGLDTLEIKEGVRKKLREGEESARLSYWLATIVRDAPTEFKPEDNIWNKNFTPDLYPMMKRLGFQKFIEKWGLHPETGDEQNMTAFQLPRISVEGAEDLSKLAETVRAADRVAVLSVRELDCLELCDGTSVYTASRDAAPEDFTILLSALFDRGTAKISHNVKDFMRLLLQNGLNTEGFTFDMALAGYLLDSTASDYSLERLSATFLGTEYTGTEALWRLEEPLKDRLRELGMLELYQEAELPLCTVLAEMETAGFLIDRDKLSDFGENLNEGIDALRTSIWQHAGHEFNIQSTKQLGEVLFEELYLPSGKKTKTGWSTNADVLEKLRGKHPIVDEVLEYRMLTKLKSTYADGLLKVISEDGRIHTSFQMTVTATGRLSSTEPNLQNIPIRKKLGAQIREMFVAAPGMTLVDADYSQIELRLLAHISGDEAMREAFLSGEDFHAVTASRVFNVPLSDVTPLLRSRAKAVNFGIVYGISAFSLAQDIGVFPNEAKAYMDAYLEKYHGVREYMKRIVEQAKQDGYVTTAYGRRRSLPELKSANFNTRQFGERVALNMPIQGTAADIIKIAMVNVSKRLKQEGLRSRLLLQVHDELIAECPEEEVETVKHLLKQEMEQAASLSVPLTADVKAGHSWAEAH